MKVLIVGTRKAIVATYPMFEAAGYEVVAAHTAITAFRRAIREKVQAVFITSNLEGNIDEEVLLKTLNKYRPEIQCLSDPPSELIAA